MTKMSKSKSRRGADLVEFTISILPLLSMIFVLMDVSWGIFVKSSLAFAVRSGVRMGITVTGTQAGASTLTALVKKRVQISALGLLGSNAADPRYSQIKVHYFKPPDPGTGNPLTDVCPLANGNAPGNVMQVSVQGFTLTPLAARIFSWKSKPDSSTILINAVASDLIEPSRDPPTKGTAP